MNQEPRDKSRTLVAEARNALRLYMSGLPIDAILHMHPVSYFDQHSAAVWAAVFEKVRGRKVGAAIEKMNIYEAFSDSEETMFKQPKPEAYAKSVAMLALTYLSNKTDAPKCGLTLLDLAKILRVFLGHPKLAEAVRAEATNRVALRISITKNLPPERRAPGWIEKAEEVKRMVDEIFTIA